MSVPIPMPAVCQESFPRCSRSAELLHDHRLAIWRTTDRLFAGLLVLEWLSGIAIAIWLTPLSWIGQSSSTHPHVWLALLAGPAWIFFPVALGFERPGQTLTRHAMAVTQMLWAALFVHLTGGRIESHFSVFVSLALLAFYRDWKVLISASVVVTVDHIIRGIYWPLSVYGLAAGAEWRWVEHAGWVVAEDAFLIWSCLRSQSEMHTIAQSRANLEDTLRGVGAKVEERTAELAAAISSLQTEAVRRRVIEEELRHSQAELERRITDRTVELTYKTGMLQSIIDTLGEGLLVAKPDGELIVYNPAAERIHGIGMQDARPQDWSRAYSVYQPAGGLYPTEQLPLTRALRGEDVGDTELTIRRPDGSWVLISAYARPLRSSDGAVAGALVLIRDITALRQAEQQSRLLALEAKRTEKRLEEQARELASRACQLADSKARLEELVIELQESKQTAEDASLHLQSILAAAGEGIYGLDTDGVTTFLNPVAATLLGYDVNELVGQPMHALIHHSRKDGTHFPREECQILSACTDGVVRRVSDEVFWRKDGSSFPVDYVSTPLWKAGEIVGVVCVFQDVSEHVRTEAALLKAKQVAEAANQTKSLFLATMSHEMRTPLNGVIGPLGLVIDSGLTDKQRSLCQIARSSAESLLSLINDVLDFSQIEAGKLTLESIPFDLYELAEQVGDMLSFKAEEKRVRLLVDYDCDAPARVVGDPARIRQILTNLAGNAVKFTQEGYVAIGIDADKNPDGTCRLRLVVQDTGPGIPEIRLKDIFDAFTQADASTRRCYGGSGLGLTITKRLVDHMGGRIGVTSQVGKGSVFRVELTLPIDDSPTPSEVRADASRFHWLVVSPWEPVRQKLRRRLAAWGGAVTARATPAEALEELCASDHAADASRVLVVDPPFGQERETLEVAERIQKRFGTDRVRLVLLAPVCMAIDQAATWTAGADLVIPRPVHMSALRRALTRLAGDRAAEAPTPEKGPQAGSAPISFRDVRVLVVDDNPVNRQVAEILLQSLQCQAESAASGHRALEMLAGSSYHAVLMDCEMPDMDGFETTQAIRQRGFADLPVIAMTAKGLKGDKEKCLAAGMDDYITKPVTQDSLAAVLHLHCTGSKPAPNLPTPERPPLMEDREPPLDPDAVKRWLGLAASVGPELIGELSASFRSDAVTQTIAMKEAVRKADAKALRSCAHALKGSCANLGAQRMRKTCLQMERLADSGQVTPAEDLISELEHELCVVEEQLKLHFEKGTER